MQGGSGYGSSIVELFDAGLESGMGTEGTSFNLELW